MSESISIETHCTKCGERRGRNGFCSGTKAPRVEQVGAARDLYKRALEFCAKESYPPGAERHQPEYWLNKAKGGHHKKQDSCNCPKCGGCNAVFARDSERCKC